MVKSKISKKLPIEQARMARRRNAGRSAGLMPPESIVVALAIASSAPVAREVKGNLSELQRFAAALFSGAGRSLGAAVPAARAVGEDLEAGLGDGNGVLELDEAAFRMHQRRFHREHHS